MNRQPTVAYAVVEGREGKALVAARGGKVVASFLPGSSSGALVKRLRSRFPGAAESPAGEVPGAEALRRWLDGDASALGSVPLDLAGLPPFASKVYRELRRVPPGRTLTYGELARRAGSPGAARAVGRAMATNPLAPFVPCHRVVGSDGGLRGFSSPGGIPQKARMLATEARANP
jgi:methylated-DNA-[protein]-cysteine S-methyltransferase